MIPKKVVGIVGMPGSGKSVVDDVATNLGFSIVIMGDVIREEVANMNLEPTSENIGKTMLHFRKEKGLDAVARMCLPRIQALSNEKVIVEGIRNLSEVYTFRQNFHDFKLIAIHASPSTRFYRIFKRNRSDDAANWNTFLKRDLREIQVGIGSAIALADYAIINEGSFKSFKNRVRNRLQMILDA